MMHVYKGRTGYCRVLHGYRYCMYHSLYCTYRTVCTGYCIL